MGTIFQHKIIRTLSILTFMGVITVISNVSFASMGEARSHLYDTITPYEFYSPQMRTYIRKKNEEIHNDRIKDAKNFEKFCFWVAGTISHLCGYIYDNNLEQ